MTKKSAAKKTLKKPQLANKAPKKVISARKPAAKAASKRQSVAKPVKKLSVGSKSSKAVASKKPMAKPAPLPKQEKLAKPMMAGPKAPMPAVAAKQPFKTEKSFKVGHYVVYPTHGVGKIMAEETQKVGEIELRLFVISFEKDKMTLRVPVSRATAAGLRNISSMNEIEQAFATLRGRARTSRGMWSRRAQEYEAKINSGSIFSVAEVVRDLHRNVDQSERSYSERMIYESALGRLVGELAAAQKLDAKAATDKLMSVLKTQAA